MARQKGKLRYRVDLNPGVTYVMPIVLLEERVNEKNDKICDKKFSKKDTILEIGGHKIGGGHFLLIAGPCSVENKEMVFSIAKSKGMRRSCIAWRSL